MSFSFKLKSHPDKLLYEHLKNVGKLSKEIVLCKEIKNKDAYSEIAYLIAIAHDFAKATTYFQEYLGKGKATKNARHGLLSSIFGYYVVKKYFENKQQEKSWYLPPIAWIVILRHHGDIHNIRGMEGEIERLKDKDEMEIVEEQIKTLTLPFLGFNFLDIPQ